MLMLDKERENIGHLQEELNAEESMQKIKNSQTLATNIKDFEVKQTALNKHAFININLTEQGKNLFQDINQTLKQIQKKQNKDNQLRENLIAEKRRVQIEDDYQDQVHHPVDEEYIDWCDYIIAD